MGLALPALAQMQAEAGQAGGAGIAPVQTGTTPLGSNPATVPGGAIPALDSAAATGLETTQRRPWSIVPRISVTETLTDNVAPASGVKRSDQVTEISPGIRIDSYSARLNFHLDYQLRQLLYAQESGRKNSQNYLNSFGTFEAVDKWLFVDMSGVVTQQELSPFSFQSANTTVNTNRIETSNFRVSPYIRGQLAAAADYEVRYNRSATRSNSTLATDVDIDEWKGTLKGHTPLSFLGWGLDASRREIDFQGGRNNKEERYRGLLTFRLHPEFRVLASAGQESNNFSSASTETHSTNGVGFEWQPSERTLVKGFRERRFFGDGHDVSISHRTPLTVFRFVDSRDVSVLPSRLANVGFGTIHDLLFEQFASRITDPIERSRYVDTLLQQYGIAPDAVVTRGFMTSRVAVQRHQELSYAIQWVRDIITFTAVRNELEGVGLAASADVFSTSRNIRQRGFSISYAHRLTPLSTLNVVAGQQNSSGTGGTVNQSSELQSLQVSVSTKLGTNMSASLGARRNLFESTLVRPYAENAVIGSVTAQF